MTDSYPLPEEVGAGFDGTAMGEYDHYEHDVDEFEEYMLAQPYVSAPYLAYPAVSFTVSRASSPILVLQWKFVLTPGETSLVTQVWQRILFLVHMLSWKPPVR